MTEQLDKELELNWQRLMYRIKPKFKQKPNLQSMLFLIGIQELGQLHREFTKEEKEDLMHVAVCHLMSMDGYYVLEGKDDDGWPHFSSTNKEKPEGVDAQEKILKGLILEYFKEE